MLKKEDALVLESDIKCVSKDGAPPELSNAKGSEDDDKKALAKLLEEHDAKDQSSDK